MKLTKTDRNYLFAIGYTKKDMLQISDIAKYTKYEIFTKEDESITTRITQKRAIEILGRNTFLSGLGRAAFHQSAVRYNDEGTIYVVFDNNKFMDKGKELNTEFNEIYNLISDVDNMVDTFYAKHFLFNRDIDANSEIFKQVSKLQMMMSQVKCLSHEIAEFFTWDK